ncbi:hypothetical protein HMPREF9727_02223 [Treponema denticola MYR-T]|uniref:Uncharacterized protein n=1 Tax=Treponema denticola H1-T TaxID=999431 RepID=M2AXR5_TREDN|nr:hypothetical protein [Treponema denticola]EMB27507.1 hypothetical protein HMPREF9727_02223 [Treponema denticola MYR-T]EMB28146.1 hypothetical protein HMPREF9725_02576 [Treponema denticola H1-T]
MEFDKNRVYTAVNADELKIGSRCIFADTVKALRKEVETGDPVDVVLIFTRLYESDEDCGDIQFSDGFYAYKYAYLIELPAETKYKPFESAEKAMEAIKKHGGWIKKKSNGYQYIVIAKSPPSLRLSDGWFTLEAIFYDYVFADDGSPCGELVEE